VFDASAEVFADQGHVTAVAVHFHVAVDGPVFPDPVPQILATGDMVAHLLEHDDVALEGHDHLVQVAVQVQLRQASKNVKHAGAIFLS
jgi:hypothetical protein